jgi:L-malate glycosyltransferase
VKDLKKILYIEANRDGTIGGSYYSLLYLIQGLDKTKYEPHVLFCQDNLLLPLFKEATPHVYVDNFGPSYSAPVENISDFVKWPYRFLTKVLLKQFRIRKIIAAIRPDLVHLNNSHAVSQEWILACLLHNIKVVAHDRGTPFPCSFQTKIFSRFLDAILCVSESYKHNVLLQKLKPCMVKRVYDGIRADNFDCIVPSDVEKIRIEFGLASGAATVGIVGNIIRWKGQDVVLRAIEEVKRYFPDVKCLIIGKVAMRSESYKDELDTYIKDNGLEKNIIFTGFRKDVPQIIATLDVLIHASTEPEPFGLVILEGMAMNKPVIATNHGGPTEIVLRHETGFLVSHTDHSEMAAAIIFCLTNKEAADAMGRRGRERFVKTFTSDIMVEETEKIYSEIFN